MKVDHLPTRMFYRKEVFLSSLEGSMHRLISILRKCVILSFSEYYRPTEYADDDVFACQYKYFADEKVARKLKKGLKKALLSRKALDDEIYFFRKELIPSKEQSILLGKCSTEPIRQEYITRMCSLLPGTTVLFHDEDSKDTSMTHDDSVCSMSVASSGNNGSDKILKKVCGKKVRKPPSGYVLYAGEIRKKLLKDNPEAQFGVISKEVGQMADKDVYERRALEIKQVMEKEAALTREVEIRKNDTLLKQHGQIQNVTHQMYVTSPQLQNQRNYIQVPPTNQQLIPTSSATFQNNAPNIQYFQTSNGQVLQFMPSTNVPSNVTAQFATSSPEQQVQFIQQPAQPSQQVVYQLSPQSLGSQQVMANPPQFVMHQNKISSFPAPQISSTQQSGSIIPNISGANFNTVQQSPGFSGFSNHQISIPTNISQGQSLNPSQNQVTQAPQHFISVSSRSARVLHSDIYQRYIDKLRKNASTLSDWKQQLEFSKESVLAAQGNNRQTYMNKLCQDVAPGFLDSKLLIDKDGKKMNQEAVVDCLFQLRDHMLQDAMNIRTKVLGLSEL